MFKNIAFYSSVFSIALFTNVKSAESGGMPQLNPEFWISQIFWLILTFSTLFVILSKFILPKISKNIEFRKSQILENIEMAEKQKEESENKIKEYEAIILKSKSEARNYFNEARKKILQDIDKKKQQLENEIDEEVNISVIYYWVKKLGTICNCSIFYVLFSIFSNYTFNIWFLN